MPSPRSTRNEVEPDSNSPSVLQILTNPGYLGTAVVGGMLFIEEMISSDNVIKVRAIGIAIFCFIIGVAINLVQSYGWIAQRKWKHVVAVTAAVVVLTWLDYSCERYRTRRIADAADVKARIDEKVESDRQEASRERTRLLDEVKELRKNYELLEAEFNRKGTLRPGTDEVATPYDLSKLPENAVVLLYGNTAAVWSSGRELIALRHSGTETLTVSNVAGGLELAGAFYDQQGKQIGFIKHNRFTFDQNIGMLDVDLTSRPHTLRVVDEKQKTVVEVQYPNKRVMRIYADFYTKDGQHVEILDHEIRVNGKGKTVLRNISAGNSGFLDIKPNGDLEIGGVQ